MGYEGKVGSHGRGEPPQSVGIKINNFFPPFSVQHFGWRNTEVEEVISA